MPTPRARALSPLAAPSLALLLLSCVSLDLTPVDVGTGSLGEEIYLVFCERASREAYPNEVDGQRLKAACRGREEMPEDAPPRLRTMARERARIVAALDRILPEELEDPLASFMGELIPLFDPPRERFPQQTRKLADLLDRLSGDEEALAALARLGAREGMQPARFGLGAVRPALRYPGLAEVTSLALAPLAPGGAAAEPMAALERALALEAATLTPSEATPEGEPSDLELLRDLVFREDGRFASERPRWVLRRDARGLPAISSEDGTLPAPFVDTDGDGLADIDELGRFVDTSGAPLEVPAPFAVEGEGEIARDGQGRALRADGSLWYEYFDADRTMLAGALREAAPWFSNEGGSQVAFDLARALPPLLGPTVEATSDYNSYTLRYSAYDTAESPMVDAVYGLTHVIDFPETDRALQAVYLLMRDHQSELAGTASALLFLYDRADAYPEAQIQGPSNFADDMLDLLVRFERTPGLLDALLRVFEDPRSATLGPLFGRMMLHRDRIEVNPLDPNGPPLGLPFDEPVDHAAPEGEDNESAFQRTLALIDGLNGVEVCNRAGARLHMNIEGVELVWPPVALDPDGYAECEFLRIPNVAEAYADSILGEYELPLNDTFLTDTLLPLAAALGTDVDAVLEENSGIDGMTQHPTPQAMARLVFWGLANGDGEPCTPDDEGGDCNSPFAGQLLSPVRDRHGNDVITFHRGTIFAFEQPGLYDALQPLLQVLQRSIFRYGPSGEYFFGELMGTLHRFWASRASTRTQRDDPAAPNYSAQSDLRSFEPLLAEGLIEAALLDHLHRLTLATRDVEVEPFLDATRVLAEAGAAVLEPNLRPGLTTRDGRTEVEVADGSRTAPVSPAYLLLIALDGMDEALDAAPDRREAFEAAVSDLLHQFLGASEVEGSPGTYAFEAQRARAMLLIALPFLRERIAAHRDAGDLTEWSLGLTGDVEDLLREPAVNAGVRLLDALGEDPEARRAMGAMVAYLLTDDATEGGEEALHSLLTQAADALFLLEDEDSLIPIVHALSVAFAPNVREALRSGAELDVEAAVVHDVVDLLPEIDGLDEEHTLTAVLANAAVRLEPNEPGEQESTPIERLIDAMLATERLEPGADGALRAEDYRQMIENTRDFLRDEERGVERLVRVVQSRQLPTPEEAAP